MSDSLSEANARLERALARLEEQRRETPAAPDAAHDAVSDDDLFAGRIGAHDNELRAAAQEASRALAEAADALRAAIGEEG